MNHNSDRSSFTVGVPVSAAITRVILRSAAASVLIAVALTAGAYLFWLVLRGQLGLVHVRWLSRAAFAFLMVAPAMLLAANRSYSAQRRGYGFAFLVRAQHAAHMVSKSQVVHASERSLKKHAKVVILLVLVLSELLLGRHGQLHDLPVHGIVTASSCTVGEE